MRDLRRYARQTNRGFVFGGLFIIIAVALSLIYIFYGEEATLLGLGCILAALSPIILVFLILQGLDWWVKRTNQNNGNA